MIQLLETGPEIVYNEPAFAEALADIYQLILDHFPMEQHPDDQMCIVCPDFVCAPEPAEL